MIEKRGETVMPKCPKCGSENIERLGGGVGSAPEGGDLPAITYKCKDCGYVFSDKDLNKEE